MASFGIVEWFGGGERGHRCGYCSQSSTNKSDGMWSHALTVQNYQDLIDRGWRRSGKYCYKPLMEKTCCPHYTIKCEALNFKMSKSHKKIIKQFNKYIIKGIVKGDGSESKSGDGPGEMSTIEKQTDSPSGDTKPNVDNKGSSGETTSDIKTMETASQGDTKETSSDTNAMESTSESSEKETSSSDTNAIQIDSSSVDIQRGKQTPRKGDGADPNKPKCKKAKQLRMERKKEKQMKTNPNSNMDQPSDQKQVPKSKESKEKTLEEYLDEYKEAKECAHKFEIRLVRSCPRSKEFKDSFKESHKVYHRYQMAIHKDPPEKPNESQYTRFLCDSPLQEEHKEGGIVSGYGSFHQQYILDGKIIAVGVIDILPTCVSSVYLYYHPDYNFLTLGTYTALQEIAFVRSLNKLAPDLIYYYMGYYIHSCPKMRYKGQYYPSFLLCPETYSWNLIQECEPKLDQNKYSRFAEEGKEDEDGKVNLDDVQILYMRQKMNYEIYKGFNQGANDQAEVKKYATLVGKKCATGMLLYRN